MEKTLIEIVEAIREIRFANNHLRIHGDDGSGYVERLHKALDDLVESIPTIKSLDRDSHIHWEFMFELRKIMTLLWGEDWRGLEPFEFSDAHSLAAFVKNPQGV